jgi:NAD(P)-dependent dehydrogenase (short-subunit alcohol dehydrogenase family)
VARTLAAEGCSLVTAARSLDLLDAEAAALRAAGAGQVRTFGLDLADPAARDALVAAAPDVDILVNNAGDIPSGSIDDIDDASWRQGWDLKVFGYIGLTRAYLARMEARRSGVIINIIGAAGERPDPNYIAGAMGNASLMAFSRALGSTSADFGVRVVGVNPSATETERNIRLMRKRAERLFGDESRWREVLAAMPFGRAATCEEIAAAVAFLASDRSGYTTGTIVTIDGGMAARSGAARPFRPN